MNVGDKVRKIGGSYQATGTIKAVFEADDGSNRYVFRFDSPPGLLHIFNGKQLELINDKLLYVTIIPKREIGLLAVNFVADNGNLLDMCSYSGTHTEKAITKDIIWILEEKFTGYRYIVHDTESDKNYALSELEMVIRNAFHISLLIEKGN